MIGSDEIVVFPNGIESGAGIKVLRRFLDKSGFDRVPLDVAAALKVIALLMDSRASEAFLEDVPRKSSGLLEVAGIGKLKPVHERGKISAVVYLDQKMKMVRHQAVMIERGFIFCFGGTKMVEEAAVIDLFLEEIPSIVAAIEDVIDAAVHQFSWSSRHRYFS